MVYVYINMVKYMRTISLYFQHKVLTLKKLF